MCLLLWHSSCKAADCRLACSKHLVACGTLNHDQSHLCCCTALPAAAVCPRSPLLACHPLLMHPVQRRTPSLPAAQACRRLQARTVANRDVSNDLTAVLDILQAPGRTCAAAACCSNQQHTPYSGLQLQCKSSCLQLHPMLPHSPPDLHTVTVINSQQDEKVNRESSTGAGRSCARPAASMPDPAASETCTPASGASPGSADAP